MFCKSCGSQMPDTANVCSQCGAALKSGAEDKGGFLWGLLGCCIPVVGLILFLVWKGEKPKTAKAAGVGALVGVIISVVFSIIYSVFFAAMLAALA